jgi:GT2 family glycosyltransferase
VRFEELVTHDSGVLVPPREGTAATYLDGAEQYLLDALRACRDVSVFSQELRTRVHDWASLYHLTPYRATIMDALGFSNRAARVLELGAGCGAVTRWLGEHFEAIDTVEGSLARAQVARERCRDLDGVRIAAANFFDVELTGYDVTTLIGVLEYSHLYHPEFRDDPGAAARSNLELARRSLVDGGALVIAIENKLGLKYLAGSHEDHASRRFEGIEGYPSRRSAVTWSARELEALVLAAGFTGADFYLPFPDYKLARTVFDASLAGESTYPANWTETPFPDRAGAQARAPFNESLALREVVRGGLLRDLSNSFLVLAYNGDREAVRGRLGIDGGWSARHYSLDRRPAFCKRTSLEGDVVRNTHMAAGELVPAGLVQQLEDEPFRPGDQLLFTFLEDTAAGRDLRPLIAELRAFLLREYGTDAPGLLRGEALDATPSNIVVDPASGEWSIIDREWRFDGVLPVDYVVWRGLYHAAARYPDLPVPPEADLYQELERFIQRAAGAEPGVEPDPSARVRELLNGAEETVRVLAYARELLDHPELLATFWEALAGEAVTLVAYAPDADPAEVAGPLEAALAPYEHADVILLAVPSGDEERVAESIAVLLTHDEPFAEVPAASDVETLRKLALGREVETPVVSIVIPVFNRADLTRQCLEALREVTPEPAYEVIVVDNGSTDGTGWFLRTEQAAGRVRALFNPANRGFGAACNQGASIARGEYLVLLNNDTIPKPGWLAPLVETASDPSVGIAGSRLLYADGRIQHAGIVWDAKGELSHIHRFARADDPAVLVPRDFAAVTGACVIMRRATFFELGAFDADFYMYVEDVDLCLRAWEAGLRVTYCPESVLTHLENASVTDLAWRDENVRAGWQRLEQRWFGRWPDEVRRFAWPHRLAGSAPHPAALCFAAELAAHPELLTTWKNDAKLVLFGTAEEIEEVVPGLERPDLDLVVVTAPAGVDPPPDLVAAVTAQLSA